MKVLQIQSASVEIGEKQNVKIDSYTKSPFGGFLCLIVS